MVYLVRRANLNLLFICMLIINILGLRLLTIYNLLISLIRRNLVLRSKKLFIDSFLIHLLKLFMFISRMVNLLSKYYLLKLLYFVIVTRICYFRRFYLKLLILRCLSPSKRKICTWSRLIIIYYLMSILTCVMRYILLLWLYCFWFIYVIWLLFNLIWCNIPNSRLSGIDNDLIYCLFLVSHEVVLILLFLILII